MLTFSDRRRRQCRAGISALLALLLPPQVTFGALPIWQLDGPVNTVTIIGSIHYLRPDDPLPAPMLAAYDEAEVIVMELDLDDLDALAMQGVVQRLGMDPEGRPLEILLGPQQWRRAQEKARAMELDLTQLRGFEPWLAAVTVTQLRLQQLGFAADFGVEQQILQRARRDNKEIRGLETAEAQLRLLDELSPAAQRSFLLMTLDEAATIGEEIDDILAAWRTGDLIALEDTLLEGLREQREIYQNIVARRNRSWVEPVVDLLRRREDYLVVVGALHLVGPDSLIRLLAKDGYAPRQVTAPGPR